MKTALITGASRGLGRALATDLAGRDWHVVIDARGEAALTEAAAALPVPGRVSALAGDINDTWHREHLVAAAGSRLDLLVLNASALGPSPLPHLADYDLAELQAVFATNAVAQLGLIQAALPVIRASGGRILAVTSDAAVEGYPGWGGYGASKAALDQMIRVLAAEEPALRVYSVDPGDMRTQMHADAFPGEDISDRPEPETAIPALRRLIEEDLASGRYTAAQLTPSGVGR